MNTKNISVREISNISELSNKEAYYDISDMIYHLESGVVYKGGKAYVVICVPSTEYKIKLVDYKLNKEYNDIQVYWDLDVSESVGLGKKIKVLEVDNKGYVVKVEQYVQPNLVHTYDVIAINVADKTHIVSSDGSFVKDVDVWTGEGIYSISLDDNGEINNYQSVPTAIIQGTAVYEEDSGMCKIKLMDGTEIEAFNSGDTLLNGMEYKFDVYYNDGFEVSVNEMLVMPRAEVSKFE